MQESSAGAQPTVLEVRYDKFVFRIPSDLLYSPDDVWVRLERSVATIGITDFRQQSAGDLTFATPRRSGDRVLPGESIATIETMKTVFDVPSPVEGTIVTTNEDLVSTPESINLSPYGDGWIVKVELADPHLTGLLTPDEYAKEVRRKAEEEAR